MDIGSGTTASATTLTSSRIRTSTRLRSVSSVQVHVDGSCQGQVIVNGLANGAASEPWDVENLIQDGQTQPPNLVTISKKRSFVRINGPPNGRGLVQVVVYDPKTYDIDVLRGENGGKTMIHRNVVKELVTLGWWEGGKIDFPVPDFNYRDEGMKKAVLVQKETGGPIIGAAKF